MDKPGKHRSLSGFQAVWSQLPIWVFLFFVLIFYWHSDRCLIPKPTSRFSTRPSQFVFFPGTRLWECHHHPASCSPFPSCFINRTSVLNLLLRFICVFSLPTLFQLLPPGIGQYQPHSGCDSDFLSLSLLYYPFSRLPMGSFKTLNMVMLLLGCNLSEYFKSNLPSCNLQSHRSSGHVTLAS